MIDKVRQKVEVTRYSCPIEGCDVTVYVTYNTSSGRKEVSNYACDRQGKCGIPLFDPCPLYLDLAEHREIHKKP